MWYRGCWPGSAVLKCCLEPFTHLLISGLVHQLWAVVLELEVFSLMSVLGPAPRGSKFFVWLWGSQIYILAILLGLGITVLDDLKGPV